MMSFIHKDFMLKNKTAQKLYHEYAENLPIIDYHCHIPVEKIANDYRFKNAADLFLGGDHYKWRLMRTNGIDEDRCTGSADDFDKWMAFAETVPLCIGNPMYHWTHLELKRYFDVDVTLNPDTAKEIWEQVNSCLAKPEFSAGGLIKRSNVEVVCTTDAPEDTLEHHQALRKTDLKVIPAFRPDLKKVDSSTPARIDFFHENGCRLSDHAVDDFEDSTIETLVKLGKEYTKRDWTMQLHVGAMRNNNTPMFERLGPDTGFDSINGMEISHGLAKLLDAMEKENALPKTILYNLNPADNYIIGTLMGCYQKGPTAGKIQFGSGWWFNDQRDGMEAQLKALANLSLLPRFIGMTTDSRSFVSYPRHEYFRRILCNLIGTWVEDGEYPADWQTLGKIVTGICYRNAKDYFQF